MGRELRFGARIETNLPWPVMIQRAQLFESLGFDVLWLPDHLVSWVDTGAPRFDAWTALAGLAMVTRRIRLGTLVTHSTYRNPAAIARAAITLDHVSGGRLELGIGGGGAHTDFTAAGLTPASPRELSERYEETVAIIDALLRGEELTHAGRHYSIEGLRFRPAPLQLPRPPLMLAALGRRSLQLVARHGDGWNSFPIPAGLLESMIASRSVENVLEAMPAESESVALTRRRNEMLDGLCLAAGRDPASLRRSVIAGSPYLGPGRPWASVEAFRDYVERYREAGIDEFVFFMLPEDNYPADAIAPGILERVAHEVIPALKARAAGK